MRWISSCRMSAANPRIAAAQVLRIAMQAIVSPSRLAPSQQARPTHQQAGVAASLARPALIQQKKQHAGRSVVDRVSSHTRRQAAGAARRQAAGRVVVAKAAAKAGGDVLVVGSSGQTAARVVVNLLRTGFKVTAGVDTDIDESQELVKFAKQLEILSASEANNLKLSEFNPLDGESIATVLKRGSRVVLVVGDQAGSRRPDLRIYDAVLDALLENEDSIGQLVVVTPLGGSGTGLFGRGGSGGTLTPLEQRVVGSGCPYLLVRAAPSDRVTDRYGEEANVVVTGVGELPKGLQASRSQVAAVVAQAMAQAQGDAIIEVGASAEAEYDDVASLVAVALEGGAVEEEEEEEEEEVEVVEEAPKKVGFFTIGGGRKQQAAPVVEEVVEEEEEEEEPEPPKRGGFFGFGTRKIARPAPVAVVEEVVEEEQEEEPEPPKRGGFFGFGTRKIARPAPAAAAAVEEEEEEEPAPAPAKPARRGFSFGTMRLNKPSQPEPEEEEEEEAEPAPAKRGSGFRFGGSSRQAATAVVEEVEEEVVAAPPSRPRRGRNPIAVEPEQPAPKAAAPAKVEAEAPIKKSGGFLGLLGIQQETAYVDEL